MKKIDLAQMMMEKIKEVPELMDYLKVTEGAEDVEALPLANLFVHLDEYYNKATTIKSALHFLTEDVGINQRHCILILAIEDPKFCGVVASIIGQATENYYIARANNIIAAQKLVSFFNLNQWACGLVIEDNFCGQECDPFIKKCEGTGVCVLIDRRTSYRYLKLLSMGVGAIVNMNVDLELFTRSMEIALVDMFMEGME